MITSMSDIVCVTARKLCSGDFLEQLGRVDVVARRSTPRIQNGKHQSAGDNQAVPIDIVVPDRKRDVADVELQTKAGKLYMIILHGYSSVFLTTDKVQLLTSSICVRRCSTSSFVTEATASI